MALLKWTTPKVVRRHEWHTEGKPLLLKLIWICLKWGFLLCLPTLYVIWRVMPAEVYRLILPVLCVPGLLLLQLSGHLLTHTLTGRDCRLDGKGLLYKFVHDNRRIYWQQIHSWAIDDHPRIMGIRVLTVKATRLRRPRTLMFPFNPRTVDETRLRQTLAAHFRA